MGTLFPGRGVFRAAPRQTAARPGQHAHREKPEARAAPAAPAPPCSSALWTRVRVCVPGPLRPVPGLRPAPSAEPRPAPLRVPRPERPAPERCAPALSAAELRVPGRAEGRVTPASPGLGGAVSGGGAQGRRAVAAAGCRFLALEVLPVPLNPGLCAGPLSSHCARDVGRFSPGPGRGPWAGRRGERPPRTCLLLGSSFSGWEGREAGELRTSAPEVNLALWPWEQRPRGQRRGTQGPAGRNRLSAARHLPARAPRFWATRRPRTSTDVTPAPAAQGRDPARAGAAPALPAFPPPGPFGFPGGGDAGAPSVWGEPSSADPGLGRRGCRPRAGRCWLEGGRGRGPCLDLPGLVPSRLLPSVTTEIGALGAAASVGAMPGGRSGRGARATCSRRPR